MEACRLIVTILRRIKLHTAMERLARLFSLARRKRPPWRLLPACGVFFILAFLACRQQVVFHRTQAIPPGQDARRNRQVLPLVFARGNPRLKQVVLTFDDGPHPISTPKLLSVLGAHDIKATFFVVGERAKRYPELIRMECDEGHTVANHTLHHVSLPAVSSVQAAAEIAECGRIIADITGEPPRYFRPPGGQYSKRIIRLAAAQGYVTVLWTDSARDYALPGERAIEDRVLAHLGNGGIILLHDGIYQTVDALPHIITRLQREGYRFVSLDEMLSTRQHPAR